MHTIFFTIVVLVILALGVWVFSQQAERAKATARLRENVRLRAQELEANAAARKELAKRRERDRQQILAQVCAHSGPRHVGFVPEDDIYSDPAAEEASSDVGPVMSGTQDDDPGLLDSWDEWANGGEGIGTNRPSRGVNPVSRHNT